MWFAAPGFHVFLISPRFPSPCLLVSFHYCLPYPVVAFSASHRREPPASVGGGPTRQACWEADWLAFLIPSEGCVVPGGLRGCCSSGILILGGAGLATVRCELGSFFSGFFGCGE